MLFLADICQCIGNDFHSSATTSRPPREQKWGLLKWAYWEISSALTKHIEGKGGATYIRVLEKTGKMNWNMLILVQRNFQICIFMNSLKMSCIHGFILCVGTIQCPYLLIHSPGIFFWSTLLGQLMIKPGLICVYFTWCTLWKEKQNLLLEKVSFF